MSINTLRLAALTLTLGLVVAAPGVAMAHTVAEGETLSGIARRYGVTVRALAEANGIANPDRLLSGTRLSLQGSGGGASTTSTGSSSTNRDGIRRMIVEESQRNGWRPGIPLGLAMQESGWNPTVVSSAGAIGVMQVMPATGEWVGIYLLQRPLDLRDPADNIAAGMAYLDYLYNRLDRNIEHTLAAYFEGPGRTTAAGGPSTPGAQRYVDNVLALADRYR
ncbi:hypothetical protein BH23ACT9_BH23ACT9_23750 [soil metagenome]